MFDVNCTIVYSIAKYPNVVHLTKLYFKIFRFSIDLGNYHLTTDKGFLDSSDEQSLGNTRLGS